MKYIAIYHANLNYSGLGPDKYEYVIRRSYEKIIDMYDNELKGVPYCFEASGYTIEMMAKYCPDVLEKLIDASKRNCEIMGSPYAHPMLPNFPYKDGLMSLVFSMEAYDKHLGFLPESGWNPECGWRHDVPQMFKDAGFKTMTLDWDSYLISNYPEVAAVERPKDEWYGHMVPYYPFDPDHRSLHFPIKIMDGLNGVFRTDRCSLKILQYLMTANPLYKVVDEESRQHHEVTKESILADIKHWSGKKGDGFMVTYAEDAEYVGTTAYFFLKYYNRNQLFEDNPSYDRVIDLMQEIGKLGGFITVKDAVRDYPVTEDLKPFFEDDMAWHRSLASNWSKTPTAIEWHPKCVELSQRLQAVEARLPESAADDVKQAWFALTCAENSDGRWPPPPKVPGEFNIEYCKKYLQEAEARITDLERRAG
jgi:hypothetical protein